MLNIHQLHKEIQKRETMKNNTYKMILEKVHYRVILTNKKSEDCYCFYVIPTFMFGVPLYNMTKCIIFVMEDLIGRGFQVNYTHPNLLFISWKEKPKQIQAPKEEKLGLVDNKSFNNTTYHPTDIKSLELKTDNLFN